MFSIISRCCFSKEAKNEGLKAGWVLQTFARGSHMHSVHRGAPLHGAAWGCACPLSWIIKAQNQAGDISTLSHFTAGEGIHSPWSRRLRGGQGEAQVGKIQELFTRWAGENILTKERTLQRPRGSNTVAPWRTAGAVHNPLHRGKCMMETTWNLKQTHWVWRVWGRSWA